MDYSDLFDGDYISSENEAESESDTDVESIVDNLNTSIHRKHNIENLIKKKNQLQREDSMNAPPTKKKTSLTNNPLKSTEVIKLTNTKINQGLLQGLNKFHRKSQEGFVDVWWLYDDGGKD